MSVALAVVVVGNDDDVAVGVVGVADDVAGRRAWWSAVITVPVATLQSPHLRCGLQLPCGFMS